MRKRRDRARLTSTSDDGPRKSFHGRPRDEVRGALRRLRGQYAMAGLFSSCINLLYLASPLYLMQVYNRVLVNESVATLVMLTLILAIALLAMAALDAVRAQMLIRCGVKLDEYLSGRVFDALVTSSARRGAGRGTERLRELDDFRTFVTGPGVHFAFDLPWIPIYLLLLFFIHPILGAVATIGAIALLGLALVNEWVTRDPLRAAEASAKRAAVFTDNIVRHADVVTAMGMQDAVRKTWRKNRVSMLHEQAFASDRNSVIASVTRFSRLLLQSLMLGIGAWLAIDHNIMPATIFAASIVLGRALVPVEQAVATWKHFVAAREGASKVRELLRDNPEPGERTIVPAAQNAVRADNITFSIPARKEPVLRDLSFELKESQAVGIVGPSGSGKSTLARLLIGAASPTHGTLCLGGLDYEHWDSKLFGRQVGYLPQDVGLLPGTVRENIARFGDASTDEVIEAAKLAGIHDMILALPKQYDTVLGPDGFGLSGGQRQRLGLARALLGQPPLVVLDEPNANLDTDGESGLRAALLVLKAAGSTIVVITHRPTILEIVDVLMVLNAGRLDALGPRDVVYRALEKNDAKRHAAGGAS